MLVPCQVYGVPVCKEHATPGAAHLGTGGLLALTSLRFALGILLEFMQSAELAVRHVPCRFSVTAEGGLTDSSRLAPPTPPTTPAHWGTPAHLVSGPECGGRRTPQPPPRKELLYSPLSAGDRCLANSQRKQLQTQAAPCREAGGRERPEPGCPEAAESSK